MKLLPELTLPDYIENFLSCPEKSFGAFTRVARFCEEGRLTEFPEEFRTFIGEVALSAKSALPIVVSGQTMEDAVSFLEPLFEFLDRGIEPFDMSDHQWDA